MSIFKRQIEEQGKEKPAKQESALKPLLQILESLQLFPTVLSVLVAKYAFQLRYSQTPYFSFRPGSGPCGLVAHDQQLFICLYSDHRVVDMIDSKLRLESSTISQAAAIDLGYDEKEPQLYVVGESRVVILSLSLEKRAQDWRVPETPKAPNDRGLKVDGSYIYLTMWGYYSIYVYDKKKNGVLEKKFGSEENGPLGLTTDEKNLYFCDRKNHRVQVVDKKTYTFLRSWGQRGWKEEEFMEPLCIYYQHDILYVGDIYSVKLFTIEGNFLQKLGGAKQGSGKGEFKEVLGIAVREDELLVTEYGNCRIQLFRRIED